MKFACDFTNEQTGERRQIVVALTPEEMRALDAIRAADGDAELIAQGYALRHAYGEMSEGFRHVNNGIRQIAVN